MAKILVNDVVRVVAGMEAGREGVVLLLDVQFGVHTGLILKDDNGTFAVTEGEVQPDPLWASLSLMRAAATNTKRAFERRGEAMAFITIHPGGTVVIRTESEAVRFDPEGEE